MKEKFVISFNSSKTDFEKLSQIAKESRLPSPHSAARQIVVTALSGGSGGGSSQINPVILSDLLSLMGGVNHLTEEIQELSNNVQRLAVLMCALAELLLINSGATPSEAGETIAQLFQIAFQMEDE